MNRPAIFSSFSLKIAACLVGLLAIMPVHAQRMGIIFSRFTQQDDLLANQVNDALKTRDGYVWVATGNGLQRYDGKRWISFQEKERLTDWLPDNKVMRLTEDDKGRLWVATAGGICYFDKRRFRFVNIPVQYATETGAYNFISLQQLDDGRIWCTLQPGGLFVLDETTGQFVPYTQILPPFAARITQIVYDGSTRQYWMGTDSGTVVCDVATRQYFHAGYNPGNIAFFNYKFAQAKTIALHLNYRRQLWVSCYDKHFCYDLDVGKIIFEDLFRVGNIKGFCTDESGTTWAYGLKLAQCDLKTGQLEVIPKKPGSIAGLDFDLSKSMFEDDEHNLWLSTDNGLFIFNPRRQHFFTEQLFDLRTGIPTGEANVTGFVPLNDGRTLVLTWGGEGVYCLDENLRQVPSPFRISPNKFVWCGIQAGDGVLWLGCQGGELYRISPGSDKAEYLENEVFDKSTVRSMTEDPTGNVWFGLQNGAILKWSRTEQTFVRVVERDTTFKASQNILQLCADSYGYLWAVAEGRGVLKVNRTTHRVERQFRYSASETEKWPFNNVYDVVALPDNWLALGTNKGLALLEPASGTFRVFNSNQGLPYNEVINLLHEPLGNCLWFTTLKGVSKLDLQTLRVGNYGLAEGITDQLFNFNAAKSLPSGEMLFGSVFGFTHFSPAAVIPEKKAPKVKITGIRVFDHWLKVDSILGLPQQLELDYHQNFLAIEFSAMSYLLRDKLDYYYQLEGLDNNWIQADASQQATYTYLPGGRYTFKVRCQTREGVVSEQITAFSIHIVPPFWQQGWFYLFILLTVAGLIYLIWIIRRRRHEETERVRSRIARDLHDDMGSMLSTVNILSEMTNMKMDGEPDKAKALVRQISDNSAQMMESLDDIVWSIDPRNDSMASVLYRMREFAGNLLEAKGIEYTFIADENIARLRLDLGKRHDFFMIFKEAVNNLAKYSQCANAEIKLDLQQKKLRLLVRDDGVGFNPDLVTDGNGLFNLQKRAASLSAELSISTTPGKGTAIELEMPV